MKTNVARELASHQCGQGSSPGVDAICGLSLSFVVTLDYLARSQVSG